MKFKVGNEVRFNTDIHMGVGVVVSYSHSMKIYGVEFIDVTNKRVFAHFYEKDLELIKEYEMEDLRELLQDGYIVKRRGDYDLCVGENTIQNRKKNYNKDLTHTTHKSCDIMEIRRPTSEHGKPVEWITVWKREEKEPEYYLKVKDEIRLNTDGHFLNYIVDGECYFFGSEPDVQGCFQTKFTREDIEQIPLALRDLCEEIKVTE